MRKPLRSTAQHAGLPGVHGAAGHAARAEPPGHGAGRAGGLCPELPGEPDQQLRPEKFLLSRPAQSLSDHPVFLPLVRSGICGNSRRWGNEAHRHYPHPRGGRRGQAAARPARGHRHRPEPLRRASDRDCDRAGLSHGGGSQRLSEKAAGHPDRRRGQRLPHERGQPPLRREPEPAPSGPAHGHPHGNEESELLPERGTGHSGRIRPAGGNSGRGRHGAAGDSAL